MHLPGHGLHHRLQGQVRVLNQSRDGSRRRNRGAEHALVETIQGQITYPSDATTVLEATRVDQLITGATSDHISGKSCARSCYSPSVTGSSRPCCRAVRIASVRERAPSFVRTLRTWNSTVFSETVRASATSKLRRPAAGAARLATLAQSEPSPDRH